MTTLSERIAERIARAAADEREACAFECESRDCTYGFDLNTDSFTELAKAIRARGSRT